jgi:hypothetical protein
MLRWSFMQKISFIITTYTKLHFKTKISIVTWVWPWNIGQRSNTSSFPDSLGMTSYTLYIYLASFHGFSLPVRKIFRISEPFEQILKRPTKGTFLPKISFLGIIDSEKILKEMLTHTRTSCHDIRSEWISLWPKKL